ncbi:hypothetical protein LRAMOSA03875 [Lichtheimia ramosa]|uniref:RNA polymerase II subunit A C-terminal domain phosphatase n=1 Tax=Lichtheimia ramosa TaxID=688394 RepID=A0A077WXT6_9FUNG|nr:hypothetical protein LRAMOSA03875 [Lichtheimia ramosa]
MEECTHEVQFHGMCAVCGKNLDKAESSKDNINMSHNTTGLTVSRKEAERLEQENAARLMEERKLSLILDLDQTVVHATWDPTVGEWMKDENNANHPATKDIRKFTLPGSSLMYYIKLRPGLSEFLEQVSKLYELHIYTMGTRHYAEAVAREIDPEDKLFRDRILSRDESGSMTQKKIQRLFPCDTSMVVVLDDRSDVWSFSPNLIKVKPYEFFVGIGDINSPFAPKQPPEVPLPPTPESQQGKPEEKEQDQDASKDKEETQEEQGNAVEEEEEEAVANDKQLLAQQERIQEAMAKEQQQQRPLAQKQNELAPGQDQPLLVDNDKELYTMAKVLVEVHDRFYQGLDAYNKEQNGAGSSSAAVKKPDVKDLIPEMRKKVLDGVRAVFSGLIPQQQPLPTSMYWQLAESFGAVCLPDLTGNVTHVIAAKAGTDKVKRARKTNRIKIVTADWLMDSVGRWERQDENKYILPDLEPVSNNESEFENPESTPFDDGAFDPEEHGLVDDIDWDEADREVDDAINESGTDMWDTDSEAIGSPTSSRMKSKRKRRNVDTDSSGGEDNFTDSDEEAKSPLSKRRLMIAKRGRSQLSQVATMPDDDDNDEGGISTGGHTTDNESIGEQEDYGEEDSDSSSGSDLDDFAGLLDGEIE